MEKEVEVEVPIFEKSGEKSSKLELKNSSRTRKSVMTDNFGFNKGKEAPGKSVKTPPNK